VSKKCETDVNNDSVRHKTKINQGKPSGEEDRSKAEQTRNEGWRTSAHRDSCVVTIRRGGAWARRGRRGGTCGEARADVAVLAEGARGDKDHRRASLARHLDAAIALGRDLGAADDVDELLAGLVLGAGSRDSPACAAAVADVGEEREERVLGDRERGLVRGGEGHCGGEEVLVVGDRGLARAVERLDLLHERLVLRVAG
jgi:hypothetical protein